MTSLAIRWTFRVFDALLKRAWQVGGRVVMLAQGIQYGERLRFYGLPIVTRFDGSTIELGHRVVLCSHPRFTALGVAHPVVLRTLRKGAHIRIGDDVGISGASICAAISVSIGNQCLMGADVQITDTDFHKIEPDRRRFDNNPQNIQSAAVVIEDNVFLGAGTRVLKGVRIGRNSVVGAGSVVTGDIPADSIAAGVPARVLRKLQPAG